MGVCAWGLRGLVGRRLMGGGEAVCVCVSCVYVGARMCVCVHA